MLALQLDDLRELFERREITVGDIRHRVIG